jgi:hypothetical protein
MSSDKIIKLNVKRKRWGKFPVDKMRQELRYHILAAGYYSKYQYCKTHPRLNKELIVKGKSFLIKTYRIGLYLRMLNYFLKEYYPKDMVFKSFDHKLMEDVLDFQNPQTAYLNPLRENVLLMGVILQLTYYFTTHKESILEMHKS